MNSVGGKFGHFWKGSWQKLLVAEFIDIIPAGACANYENPKIVDHQTWINSLKRFTEHDGERGVRVWTNRDAMLGSHAFLESSSVVGVPSGNLLGNIEIILPDFSQQTLYTTYPDPADCNEPPQVNNSEPLPIGDFTLAALRNGPSEFVPPLGVYDKVRIQCGLDGEIQIRRPDGTIDVFTSFNSRKEHLIEPQAQPSQGGGGTQEPGPTVDTELRVQAVAVPLRTIYPNGDTIEYRYDDHGRNDAIIDNYGRTVVEFDYLGIHSNKISAIRTTIGTQIVETRFEYSGDLLTEISSPTASGREWRMEYDVTTTGRPSIDPRIEIQSLFLPTNIKIYSPENHVDSPFLEASFQILDTGGSYADPPHSYTVSARVEDLWLGNKYNTPDDYWIDMDGDGLDDDYVFNTGSHVHYDYTLSPSCYGDTSTTVTNSATGLVREHDFDWQSRELERREYDETAGPTTALVTRLFYDELHPKVVKTIHPRGNVVEEKYQFQADDEAGRSYYEISLAGELVRDRFQGGNLLRRTRKSSDEENPPPATIVEEWTYEPFLNQEYTVTNGRNFVTQHFYDYQESPTSTSFSDLVSFWGIAISVPLNLVDQNGDGIDDNEFGNRVRTVHPTVSGRYTNEVLQGDQIAEETIGYNEKGQILWSRDPEGVFARFYYNPDNDPEGDQLELIAGNSAADMWGYLESQTQDDDPPPNMVGHGGTYLKLKASFGYDGLGRTIEEVSPRTNAPGSTENIRTTRAFDEFNRKLWEAQGDVPSGTPPTNTGPSDHRYKEFYYDHNDNLIEVREWNSDPAMPSTLGVHDGFVSFRYGYDMLDQLRVTWSELYDRHTDPQNAPVWLSTFYHYDDQGKIIKVVSPESRAVTYTYDFLGRVTEKRSHLDPDPNPHLETLPSSTPSDPRIKFRYDPNGNLQFVDTVRSGLPDHTVEYVYDGFDRRTQAISPEGTTVQELDNNDNITRVSRTGKPSGDPTIPNIPSVILADADYLYDQRDRLDQVDIMRFSWELVESTGQWRQQVLGDGVATTETSYDARGLTLRNRDDFGRESIHTFDGAGRSTRTEFPPVDSLPPNAIMRTYDADGNLTEEKRVEVGRDGPPGAEIIVTQEFVTTIEYDSLNRPIVERTFPWNTGQPGAPSPLVRRTEHSSRDDSVGTWDENDTGTRRYFDSQHRELEVIVGYAYPGFGELSGVISSPVDPSINSDGFIHVSRAYDLDGNLTVQTDDNGNPTTTFYDGVGRPWKIRLEDQSYRETTFYADGTVDHEDHYNPAGSPLFSVTYDYDSSLRKTSSTYSLNLTPGETALSGVTSESFQYDGLSRITKVTTHSVTPGGGPVFDTTVEKTYDSQNNVLSDSQTLDKNNGQEICADTVRCEYDGLGNRTRVYTDLSAYDVIYQVDPLNRIESVLRDGGVLHDFEYIGPGSRLRHRVNSNMTRTEIGFNGHDAFGRVAKIVLSDPTPSVLADLEYSYDLTGSILEERKLHNSSKSHRFEYDRANRLTTFRVGSPPDYSVETEEEFGLDGAGNWVRHKDGVGTSTHTNQVDGVHQYEPMDSTDPTEFDSSTLEYDSLGNLTGYDQLTFTYDARGRIVTTTDGSSTEYSVYDGEGRRMLVGLWFLLHEGGREIRQEKVTNGNSRDFVYGSGLDEILSFRKNIVEYNVHQDRLGSTIVLTDSAGSAAESFDYSPYGELIGGSGSTVGFPYLFAGRRLDIFTGLYFLRARHYHPAMGRFVSRDQIGFWGDQNNFGNPYAYAWSNPLAVIDPSGNSGRELSRQEQRRLGRQMRRAQRQREKVQKQYEKMIKNGMSPEKATFLILRKGLSSKEKMSKEDAGNLARGIVDGGFTFRTREQSAGAEAHGLLIAGASPGSRIDRLQSSFDVASLAMDASVVFSYASWVPDLFSGMISGAQGDKTGFALSMGAMVPYFGGPGNGAKILRAADKGGDFGGGILKIGDFFDSATRKQINAALEGKLPLGSLPASVREKASAFYRAVSDQVGGRFASQAREFNLERARFLDGATDVAPGKLTDFMKRTE